MIAREAAPVTLGLIAISVGVFIADWFFAANVVEWGAKSHLVWAGEWHRLIAANFIHADLPHIIFNMYALLVFGRIVEGIAGSGRCLAVYLLGGVAGFAVSLLANPAAHSVGSSAAIFAFMGFTLFHRLRYLPRRWLPVDWDFVQILGINTIMAFMVPNIDQFAHLGGFVVGVLCSSFLGDIHPDAGDSPGSTSRGANRWAGKAAAVLLLFAIYVAGFFPAMLIGWLQPVAPAVAAAMESRIEKYFTPYVVTDPALLWIDSGSPDWRRFNADATLRVPEWEPIVIGVFWRWTRGGSPDERAAYTVTWYHRSGSGAPWVRVWEESGVVDQVDREKDMIFRRGVLALERPSPFYGAWRVLVDVNGIKQFEKEYAVTR